MVLDTAVKLRKTVLFLLASLLILEGWGKRVLASVKFLELKIK